MHLSVILVGEVQGCQDARAKGGARKSIETTLVGSSRCTPACWPPAGTAKEPPSRVELPSPPKTAFHRFLYVSLLYGSDTVSYFKALNADSRAARNES